MKIDGNNNIIKGNEFYNCTTQTSDAGVIYADWDYMGLGNVIEGNYIHDFAGYKGAWTVGIYIDDQFSGTTVINNYIEKGAEGIMIGGGSFNTVKNNTIVDMNAQSLYYDNRGLTWAKDKIYDRDSRDLGNSSVYKQAYPGIEDFMKNPGIPLKAVVTGNKYYNCKEDLKVEPEVIQYGTVKDNVKLNSKPTNTFKLVDYTNGVKVTPIKDDVDSQNKTNKFTESSITKNNLKEFDKSPATIDSFRMRLICILLAVCILGIIVKIK